MIGFIRSALVVIGPAAVAIFIIVWPIILNLTAFVFLVFFLDLWVVGPVIFLLSFVWGLLFRDFLKMQFKRKDAEETILKSFRRPEQ
tara:strand:- start:573 stop:833 length:261 start_codon:yes stop_codon:yes gene_type:complete